MLFVEYKCYKKPARAWKGIIMKRVGILVAILLIATTCLAKVEKVTIVPFTYTGSARSFDFSLGRLKANMTGDIYIEKFSLSYVYKGWILTVTPETELGIAQSFLRPGLDLWYSSDVYEEKGGLIWIKRKIVNGIYVNTPVGIFAENRDKFKGLVFYIKDNFGKLWLVKVTRVFHNSLEIRYSRVKQ